MRAFMAKARRQYFTNKQANTFLVEHYERLWDFHAKCLNTWAFKRNWDNIEEVYTQADLLRIAHVPSLGAATELCDSIAWVIWDVYRQPLMTPHLSAVMGQVKSGGLRPILVTTNYDLGCENALTVPGKPGSFYPGFQRPGTISENEILGPNLAPDSLLSDSSGRVPLVKLHGSANWFGYGREAQSISLPLWLDSSNLHLSVASTQFDLNSCTKFVSDWLARSQVELGHDPTYWQEQSLVPSIIPPMLGKASVSRTIIAQWQAAIEAVSGAREIWVIGYSFPVTDAFMTRLLTEGLSRNTDLDRVVICDLRSEEEWQPTIHSMFGHLLIDQNFKFVQAPAEHVMHILSDTWSDRMNRVDAYLKKRRGGQV